MEKFVTVEVNKDTTVVGGERAIVKPKEAGSRYTVNYPGGTNNKINLGGAVDSSVRRSFTVEDRVRVEQVIVVQEGSP